MHLSGIDLFFWVAGILGHSAVLIVLILRKRVSRYPFFTSFIAANALRTVVLYLVLRYGTRARYYDLYWSLAIVDVALQAGVIYELAAGTFRPLNSWAPDVRRTLMAVVFACLSVAALLTMLAAPPAHLWLSVMVIKGNFFSEVCIAELFIAITVLSVTSGLPMKTHAVRIAQGFGVYSIIEVIIEAGHSYFGVGGNNHSYIFLSHFRMWAYLGCLCFWIAALWKNEPPERQLTDRMRLQLSDLRRKLATDSRKLRPGEGPRS